MKLCAEKACWHSTWPTVGTWHCGCLRGWNCCPWSFFCSDSCSSAWGGRLLMGSCGAVSSWPLPVPRSMQGAEPDRELGGGKGSYGSRTGPSAPPAMGDKLPA